MTEVTIRELRNRGGEVVARVSAGERMVVTRSGTPVAELRPLRRVAVPAATLLQRWRKLPAMDAHALRTDLDDVLEPGL